MNVSLGVQQVHMVTVVIQRTRHNLTIAEARTLNKKLTTLLSVATRDGDVSVIKTVCAGEWRVTVDQLNSKSRYAPVKEARHFAIMLAHEITGLSSTELGELFNREHSSVLYAIDSVRHLRTTKKYEEKFQKLKAQIHELSTNH